VAGGWGGGFCGLRLGAQNRPHLEPQTRPKRAAQIRLQDGPKTAQDGVKTAPKFASANVNGGFMLAFVIATPLKDAPSHRPHNVPRSRRDRWGRKHGESGPGRPRGTNGAAIKAPHGLAARRGVAPRRCLEAAAWQAVSSTSNRHDRGVDGASRKRRVLCSGR
jgi:hypothetical protein